ncbi:hypothetical protein ACG04Q_13065 [Roseateles sp. DXS20W]|uniref:Ankyrin repeat domain-containing protein n=1 Tax=Pelomonas lactea TaxID=3299030 RepID=A0ABW7GKM5_9BURK
MGLFELFGMGAANADTPDARAPKLARPEAFFQGPALDLLRAALADDEAGARRAVAQGANPNAQGPAATSKSVPQLTLIHYAAGVRNPRAMAILLAAGADPLFKPRDDDGDAFLFAVVRHDAQMLDALLQLYPLARIPPKRQSQLAFYCLSFNARNCLQILFDHGLPLDVRDSAGYSLFMRALNQEDLDTAEWLLAEKQVPVQDVMSSGGGFTVTPANMVQRALTEVFKPGSPPYRRYEKFKRIMEQRGIVFPVESAAEWRARMKAQAASGPAK